MCGGACVGGALHQGGGGGHVWGEGTASGWRCVCGGACVGGALHQGGGVCVGGHCIRVEVCVGGALHQGGGVCVGGACVCMCMGVWVCLHCELVYLAAYKAMQVGL